MIKCETIGMIEVAKNNPILKSDKELMNYSFFIDDGDAYVIMNTINGDNSYRENIVIPAGEPLNSFMLEAWKGQRLIIDAKHISDDFTTVSVDGTVLVIDTSTGKLVTGTADGVYLVVKGTTRLTEDAVIAKIEIT